MGKLMPRKVMSFITGNPIGQGQSRGLNSRACDLTRHVKRALQFSTKHSPRWREMLLISRTLLFLLFSCFWIVYKMTCFIMDIETIHQELLTAQKATKHSLLSVERMHHHHQRDQTSVWSSLWIQLPICGKHKRSSNMLNCIVSVQSENSRL